MNEKQREYQQMAALACSLIDLLEEVAKDKTMTADELREQINDIKGQKDELISNPQERERRYSALSLVFHAATTV